MAPVVIRLDPALTPIEALARFSGSPQLCLLQSAATGHPLSRFSFLSADPVALVSANTEQWPSVRAQLRATFAPAAEIAPDLPPFQGGWMGWFSYELAPAFDEATAHPHRPFFIPDVGLGLHDWVIAWDHAQGQTWLISSGIDRYGQPDAERARVRAEAVLRQWQQPPMLQGPVATPRSTDATVVADFTLPTYEAAVQCVINYVLAGDIFQANLAQRFVLPFPGDSRRLYHELTLRSPAPMAAFIQRDALTIASASPEQFLRLDAASGRVETRPIKGTRPRDSNPQRDTLLADELIASEKDRAENVMIVDLLRNDLSRVCQPGTVRVPALCVLESHPTVHHLVSTVVGELEPGRDALDLLAATFPGGSITGAPKLRAMEVIGELEPVARGVYSGAIGWIGLDGSMDLSIAIRTITIADGFASFHAGGGITVLSVPAEEFREALDKAGVLLDAAASA